MIHPFFICMSCLDIQLINVLLILPFYVLIVKVTGKWNITFLQYMTEESTVIIKLNKRTVSFPPDTLISLFCESLS